jgi:GDPmannose 4,6-dehydratase
MKIMSNNKYALVLGAAGQVGSYMVDYLLEKGYTVNAGVRRTSNYHFPRLSESINNKNLNIREFDLTDYSSVYNLIKDLSEVQGPQLIFNFAAMSHVHTSFNQPLYSQQSALGHLNLLEVLREFKNYYHRLWFAGSSEMFGGQIDSDGFQRITTPMIPNSPYAVAKLAAFHNTRLYRESYNLWACSGVMFNSESERRGENFVTRKITKFFAKYEYLNCPPNLKLQLGNCSAKRDWTHALDSVDAIYKMITNKEPKDYVISSMETHSVEDFYTECYNLLSSNYKSPVNTIIEVNPKYFRPNEVPYLKGDSTPLRKELGWDNKIKFKDLVRRMFRNDFIELKYANYE